MQYPIIDKKRTAKRIRFFMRCAGLRPSDIQDFLGLTCVQTVYRWLDGTNIPSVDNLYALSRLLGIKIDDMLEEDSETTPLSLTCKKYMHLIMWQRKCWEKNFLRRTVPKRKFRRNLRSTLRKKRSRR